MNEQRNPQRVTLMVDLTLDKKLRDFQAKMIEQTQKTYSYSKALNTKLAKGLKSNKKVDEEIYISGEKKRVTVMFDKELLRRIRVKFGKHIIDCAREYCEMPTWSFSKEVDKHLRKVI